ncbi:Axonemal_dynein light chain [Hexamita inflata]|uniref:Axonemal dynein light chain n=1 Tax=Hexamita inflata TaxID=28002 RepID=A0AA86Q6N1_9EUKA|nr:Axonemal dynein light chain [Hexamita inflata]CAI9947000.1 Axonemal dynein light chain [Hexamita inflata]
MRQNFLRYDPPLPYEDAEDRLKKAKSALTSANAAMEDMLNAILPPIVSEQGVQFVSKEISDQLQILQLSQQLQSQMQARQARTFGICPIRLNIYRELFDELVRQISLDCIERGILLKRVLDNVYNQIQQTQVLYESGVRYSNLKLQLKENQLEIKKINDLEAENLQLKRELNDIKFKMEGVEKNLQEKREKEKKRSDDETAFLQKHVEQLKNQLKGFIQ